MGATASVQHFLGFDVGTQGTKALLVEAASKRIVARASASYGLIEGLPAGAAEQHPHTWIDAIRATAREVLAGIDPATVLGVGISGQQHGCVVLDERGEVIRPAKLWCDTATAEEARELSAQLGRAVPTGFTASKLSWLKRHEPAHWARVRAVLLPHDYVNFRLTGRKVMEAGDASGTGWFDVKRRQFDPVAMAAIDGRMADLVPGLVAAGEPAGRLHADGAKLLGLREGTLVSAGGGDNMMSAIGSGATRPGVVVASLGTSGTVFTWSPVPVIDPRGLIAPFCSSDGGWLPLLCVMNLTGVTEEVRAAFGRDHAQLTEAAARVAPGCDGMLWLPFLQGERVPDLPGATGTLLGMRPGLLRMGHLYRAALEGTSLNLGWGVDLMRDLGIGVHEVRLVGGAARNVLWRRILAAVLGARVVPLLEPESGALGAALQALWTHHRQSDPRADLAVLSAPYVQLSPEVTEPEPELVAAYRPLAGRYATEVARLSAAQR